MPASDWWFNAGVLLAAILTITSGLNWGVWAFALCTTLSALFIWNGIRSIKEQDCQ